MTDASKISQASDIIDALAYNNKEQHSLEGISKSGSQTLPPAEDIQAVSDLSDIGLRRYAVKRTFWFFGFALILTFGTILLEGFKPWGFDLPDNFLHWLGVATIGELGGLITIVFKYLFSSNE